MVSVLLHKLIRQSCLNPVKVYFLASSSRLIAMSCGYWDADMLLLCHSHICLKSVEVIAARDKRSEVKTLVKCGLCGKEVPEQPKITAKGKCSVCGAKLTVK